VLVISAGPGPPEAEDLAEILPADGVSFDPLPLSFGGYLSPHLFSCSGEGLFVRPPATVGITPWTDAPIGYIRIPGADPSSAVMYLHPRGLSLTKVADVQAMGELSGFFADFASAFELGERMEGEMQGMMTEPDRLLLQRAQQGDRSAFDQLFGLFAGRLTATIRSRIRPGHRRRLDVQEILQDTFVQAFRSIASFHGQGIEEFRRWLTGVAGMTVLFPPWNPAQTARATTITTRMPYCLQPLLHG